MNNLTKQLANLYEPKWKELKQQLDAKDIKVQSPFMLGVALERNNQGGYVDSDDSFMHPEPWGFSYL